MIKLVIISFLLFIPLSILNSQGTTVSGSISPGVETSIIKVEKKDKTTLFKKSENVLLVKSESDYREFIQYYSQHARVPEINSFNIVSSFRKNIRFGGFWEGYAIVNFTPDMFIQPFDFLSVYASHNYSKYVPIKSVKENFKSLAIQGAAILAIDNTVKFLLANNYMIQSIVSFAAKNLIIGMLSNPVKDKKKFIEYKYYFYSVKIKF